MASQPKDLFQKCREYQDANRVRATGFYPYFRTIEGVAGSQVICGGRRKIMIGSNNYLGYAHDERVLEAAQAAVRRYGAGCTGSRFLNGTLKIHTLLEEELAQLHQQEDALVFSTGFFVNQGVITTLIEDGDFILCDRENHASILDGISASAGKIIPFAHNSHEALERRLKRLPISGSRLFAADGVFSMSGDLLDLPNMVRVCRENGVRTYIDEAHSLGVYGPKGEGVVAHFGLQDQVDLIMGTFSKSLGSQGGYVAGPADVIDFLRHRARCFMFTASLAPAVAGGVYKTLQLMQSEPERREQLWKNTWKMHQGFKDLGFRIGTTQSPIVPILIGDEIKAFEFSEKLFAAGIFTTPAAYPAVRPGEAIVRTSYMATHTDEELNYVLDTFARLGKELGIFESSAYREEAEAELDNAYGSTVSDVEGTETIREDSGAHSERRAVLRAAVSRQRL